MNWQLKPGTTDRSLGCDRAHMIESLINEFGYLHCLGQAFLVDRKFNSNMRKAVIHILVGSRSNRRVILRILVVLSDWADAMLPTIREDGVRS